MTIARMPPDEPSIADSWIYRIIRTSIRFRALVLIAMFVWLGVGTWVVWRTPIDALPDLSDNQVLVYTEWPEHTPEEIEQAITRPLSQAIRGIDGVRTVRGSSDVGFSLIHLLFEDSIPFLDARQRALERLAALSIQLPTDVRPAIAPKGIPIGQIYWYTLENVLTGSNGNDLVALRHVQETLLKPELSQIPGVAEVASIGGFEPELHIDLYPQDWTEKNLWPDEIETSIRRALRSVSQNHRDTEPQSLDPWGSAIRAMGEMQIVDSQGAAHRIDELGRVSLSTQPRYGVFEKDGNEVVAGVVHLEHGANPLQVTEQIRHTLRRLQGELPEGLRISACYDRTPLIRGAVATVTQTLLESLAVTTLGIVLILRHWRTSLVIALTLPLAIMGCFIGLALLRASGIASVQTNVMSLAGIVISIGVLVDSSIVIAENVTHRLRREFGDQPVTGDVSELVAAACAQVARPAFFAVLIMTVSFLPIFAFQGIDGKIYHPLAWTKTLTLMSVAMVSILAVPPLCSYWIRGKLRSESESRLVRTIADVYRPILNYLIDHPVGLTLPLGIVLILGAVATGQDWVVSLAVVVGIGTTIIGARNRVSALVFSGGLMLVALIGQATMLPMRLAIRLPLDEGMVMDMPITVPRMGASQGIDDLKGRNMILCRFPEIQMVAGKVGRAQTAFDPAPLDMIETMIEFRPQVHWPARRLLRSDAIEHARRVIHRLIDAELISPPKEIEPWIAEVVDAGLRKFDALQREVCWQRMQTWQRDTGRTLTLAIARSLSHRWQRTEQWTTPKSDSELSLLVTGLPKEDQTRLVHRCDPIDLHTIVSALKRAAHRAGWLTRDDDGDQAVDETRLLATMESLRAQRWRAFTHRQNDVLIERGAATWTRIVCDESMARVPILDDAMANYRDRVLAANFSRTSTSTHHADAMGIPSYSKLPLVVPYAKFESIVTEETQHLRGRLWLWPHTSESLTASMGEMDQAVRVPGWANVWTRPIQNRVDMLTTGVHSEIGIRVLGLSFDEVVAVSEKIAEVARQVPGASDVIADPIRDKDYVEVEIDEAQRERWGIRPADATWMADAWMRLKVVGEYRGWIHPIPVRLGIDLGSLNTVDPLTTPMSSEANGNRSRVSLGEIARITHRDGPATIKSENGFIRNYVRLNVRGRDPRDVVADLKRAIGAGVQLPAGISLEWSGQFEHLAATQQTMLRIVPVVVAIVVLLLYMAFRDWKEAGLMFIPIPCAMAGGVLFQWILGYPFSIAVLIGYLACVGMAAATSMIMLVYLRASTHSLTDPSRYTLEELRLAVMDGAVHRLRPKLLTEATMVLGLIPLMWSSGPGADVMRPMAAPVLGGILIADEAVDLLIPILFFHLRRRAWLRDSRNQA